MDEVVSRDGLHLNDVSYGCIARLLAESLADAARAVPPPEEGVATPDDPPGPPAPRQFDLPHPLWEDRREFASKNWSSPVPPQRRNDEPT